MPRSRGDTPLELEPVNVDMHLPLFSCIFLHLHKSAITTTTLQPHLSLLSPLLLLTIHTTSLWVINRRVS
jgi:hypothetical protein